MTDTIARGAANQAGARINKDAYAEAQDFLPLKGIDYVEFWVGNARQASAYYRALWGFTPVAFAGLETGVRDRASYVMRQNDITFVLTGAAHPGWRDRRARPRATATASTTSRSPSTTSSRHGARRPRGARCPPSSRRARRRRGRHPPAARVHTYGEVIHSFIDRRDYHGAFAPGYPQGEEAGPGRRGLSLLEVDHCVGNVGLGEMDKYVDFYRDVFGFSQLIHYDDKVIHTDYSALMSKVMTNGNGRIKFPINEPATGKKKSQIQEYLDWYLDAGCQHIALRTEDIVGTVRQLRENGVEFLGLPHEYYATLGGPRRRRRRPDRDARGARHRGRPRRGGLPPPDLHAAVQDRPTFFFEIIERHGSRGFGVGNFKALFEAIEREQAKRGNL